MQPSPFCRLWAWLALATGIVLLSGFGAQAAPVQVKPQVPGYYRYAVGDFEVTALYDGYLDLNPSGLRGMSAKNIQALVNREFALSDKGVRTAVNAYLVNTGDHLVLVDAGTAKCFGPGLGNIVGNIRAAGYAPEEIDTILLTHMHGDHFCGLETEDGKLAFPKATVWAAEEEAGYWLSEKVAAAQPENQRQAFKQARDTLGLYQAVGAFRTFKPGDAILPGVRALAAHGHTPGHTAYLFESKSHALLAWGDIVHFQAVQFLHPEVWIPSDVDHKQAIATRKALLEMLARNGFAVAGSHLSFPGIGHIRKDGKGYAWVPVEYGPMTQDH
jgi:glyoxylase-like metal-dependent hydrolase (beta-lactamase superfamily II)